MWKCIGTWRPRQISVSLATLPHLTLKFRPLNCQCRHDHYRLYKFCEGLKGLCVRCISSKLTTHSTCPTLTALNRLNLHIHYTYSSCIAMPSANTSNVATTGALTGGTDTQLTKDQTTRKISITGLSYCGQRWLKQPSYEEPWCVYTRIKQRTHEETWCGHTCIDQPDLSSSTNKKSKGQ